MKNNNKNKQSDLSKLANKLLKAGIITKILLPGTGIGSLLTTMAWSATVSDCYYNPEDYKEVIEGKENIKKLAGKSDLEHELNKFVENAKARIDQINEDKKKNNGEQSQ